jgi:hypothetical protein
MRDVRRIPITSSEMHALRALTVAIYRQTDMSPQDALAEAARTYFSIGLATLLPDGEELVFEEEPGTTASLSREGDDYFMVISEERSEDQG